MTNLLLDAVAAAVLIVLLLRPVILWYFGIARIIKHLAFRSENRFCGTGSS